MPELRLDQSFRPAPVGGTSAPPFSVSCIHRTSAIKLVPAGRRMPGGPVQNAASTIGASPSVAARAAPPSAEPPASTSGHAVLALAALSLGLGIVGAAGLATVARAAAPNAVIACDSGFAMCNFRCPVTLAEPGRGEYAAARCRPFPICRGRY